MIRPRRSLARPLILRWIFRAFSMVLVVGLLARGHVFQSLGFSFVCEHPGESSTLERESDDHGSSQEDGCPINCHGCPCGQMPMVPPAVDLLTRVLLDLRELLELTPPEEPGQMLPNRLDRPPRRARS
jgi:hypothetical protein